MSTWTIENVGGFTMSHGLAAHDPNCPPGRHPTRDCRCKVFRTRREAEAYVAEQTSTGAAS